MSIERKSYPIAGLKTDETGVIEAIVSVFNNVDSGKEIVRPGFFKKSIDRKLPKGVWAHDWRQPIAKTLEAREIMAGDPALPPHLKDLGGTYIKGQFNLETQRGREAYSDIKFGIVDEFSIGYSVTKDNKDEKTGARELIEGDWKEWSPVLVGMNDQTHLISIKGDTESGSFGSFEVVESAIENFAQKMRSYHDIRTKEGRMLSSSNRSKVQMVMDRMMELHADLTDLMMMSEPKKGVDGALRTQWLQIEGEVLSTLARVSLKEK